MRKAFVYTLLGLRRCVRQVFIFLEVTMKKLNSLSGYFSKGEIALWLCSEIVIIISNMMIGNSGWLSLIASMIGVTALIFNAKGGIR